MNSSKSRHYSKLYVCSQKSLQGKYYDYPHLLDVETDAQRGKATYPKSHSYKEQSIHLEKQLIFRACDLESPLTWLFLVNPDLGSVIPSIRIWDIQIRESVSLNSPHPHPRVLGNFYKVALPMFTVCFEMDYNPLYSDKKEASERLKPPKLGFIGLLRHKKL